MVSHRTYDHQFEKQDVNNISYKIIDGHLLNLNKEYGVFIHVKKISIFTEKNTQKAKKQCFYSCSSSYCLFSVPIFLLSQSQQLSETTTKCTQTQVLAVHAFWLCMQVHRKKGKQRVDSQQVTLSGGFICNSCLLPIDYIHLLGCHLSGFIIKSYLHMADIGCTVNLVLKASKSSISIMSLVLYPEFSGEKAMFVLISCENKSHETY